MHLILNNREIVTTYKLTKPKRFNYSNSLIFIL